MTTKKIPFDELVDKECRQIAQDLLQAELAKSDLPLPRESSLELHIGQLLSSRPDIRETAKERVEARQDAYSDSLRLIGIETEIVKPIDIGEL